MKATEPGFTMDKNVSTTRYHALDSLRAIMMLLGIVIHAAVNYVNAPLSTYLLKDPNTSRIFDALVFVIHSFRMPLFFILAGFFAALLAERRGMATMLHNRYKRIALPFLVFWLLLFPALVIIMLNGFHLMERGSWGIDLALAPQDPDKPQITTMHLWFLHYLIIFYALSYPVHRALEKVSPDFRSAFLDLAGKTLSRPAGLIILTIPIAVAGMFYPYGVVEITGSFIPDAAQMLFHGIFFFVGWIIFLRSQVLSCFRQHYRRLLLLAVICCFISLVGLGLLTEGPDSSKKAALVMSSLFANLTTWLWCFGLTGLFLEKWHRFSPWMRYLTDASYWIYLVHIVFTTSFALIMFELPVHSTLKFLLNMTATSLICVLSYHYLVRSTFVGQFLNGKKYSRRLPQETAH